MIATDATKKVEITIDRTIEHYEDIVLEYTQSGTTTTITSNDVGTCTDPSYIVELESGVSDVTIRTEKLSTSSSYTVLIVQSGIDLSTPGVLTTYKKIVELTLIILIVIGKSFLIKIVSFLILSVLTFAICKRSKS